MTEERVDRIVRMIEMHQQQSDQMQSQIASLSATVAVLAQQIEHNQRNIDSLLAWQSWGTRLVLGLVLVAIVGLVLGVDHLGGRP